jgi:hypothetical protein
VSYTYGACRLARINIFFTQLPTNYKFSYLTSSLRLKQLAKNNIFYSSRQLQIYLCVKNGFNADELSITRNRLAHFEKFRKIGIVASSRQNSVDTKNPITKRLHSFDIQ